MTDTTRQTFNRANVLTPVDTGRLRAGNNMRVRTAGLVVTGEVFNDTKYALAVHNGTRPHVIRPKRSRSRTNPSRPAALRFVVGGQVVFAQRVNHPGTRAQPWLKTALVQVAPLNGFRIVF